MPDFSNMSDEELMSVIDSSQKQNTDFSAMSDDELLGFINNSQQAQQPSSFRDPESVVDNAQPSPVALWDRLAMGFADDSGKQELLKSKFKVVQQMPNGKYLVGDNVRDLKPVDPEGMFNDVLGDIADVASEVFPIAGQVIGTGIGAGSGALTGGTTSVPGAMAGAGIGAASGEAVKMFIGRVFGLRKEDVTNDLINVAISGGAGAIGEGIFTGGGKLLSNAVKKSLDKGIKTSTNPSKSLQAIAKIFKITSGTNVDDVVVAGTYGFSNTLQSKYMNPEYSRELMTKFVKGVDLRNRALGQMVQRGDDWAVQNFGKKIVETQSAGQKLLVGLSNPKVGLIDDLGRLNRGQFTEASDRKAVQNFMQTFFKQNSSGEFIPKNLTVKDVIDLKKRAKPFLNKYFKSPGKNPLAERSIAQYLDEVTTMTANATLPKGVMITDDIIRQNPYVKANKAFSNWKKDVELLKQNGLDVADVNDIKNMIRNGKVVSQKMENFFESFKIKNSSAQQAFSLISEQLPVKFAGGGINGTVGSLADEVLKYNAAQGFANTNPNFLRMSAVAGMIGLNLGRNDPKNAAITGGLGLLLGTPAGAGVILKGGEQVLKNRFKALPKNIISKGVASQGKNILKAMVSQGTASEFKRK
jgi:hypothetical protein